MLINLGQRDKRRVGSSATSRRCPRAVGSALGDRPSSEPLLGAHRDAAGSAFRDGWPWRVVFAELPDGIPDPPLCRRAIVIAGRRRPRVSSARSAPSWASD